MTEAEAQAIESIGFHSFIKGMRRNQNPYRYGSDERQAWDYGWWLAQSYSMERDEDDQTN